MKALTRWRKSRCRSNSAHQKTGGEPVFSCQIYAAWSFFSTRSRRVVNRLSQEEEQKLIHHAYRIQGARGLLIKTLFQTGARVSEFVNIKVSDVFFDEQMILIAKAKGGKSRYIPILPALAQELKTHIGERPTGFLFETIHAQSYSPRRIQQIVKETAEQAKTNKRVYPHLHGHSLSGACRLSKSRSFSGTPNWKPPRFMQSLPRK